MEYGTSAKLANVKIWSRRAKPRGRKSSPRQILAFRLADFARLFRARYGVTLPDDDAGRDDLEPVLHHLAAMPQAARHCAQWLDLWAPWLSRAESREAIAKAVASPRGWTADQLAWRYRVTKEERTMLGLTTIGAIDQGKGARTKRRRECDRQRKTAKRRAAGAVSRSEYVQASIEHAKPWEQAGISRATWYRKRARETETGPATA